MLRKVVVTVTVLVALGALLLAGAGFYFSTLLTAQGEPWSTFDKQVLAVDGTTVVLALDDDTALPGRHALLWDGGLARLGEQRELDSDAGTVSYEVTDVRGQLTPGLEAAWYAWYFDGTPADVGLAYEDVVVPSPAGDLPSWYLPGDGGDTWVVAVHGRDGDREEALRALPTLAEAGLPTLVIRYRNDDGVPTSDGLLRLGDAEWQEVEAAMTWARERGAQRFVLVGWSMGGAVVMQVLDRAAEADRVIGVVLDGPVLDWRATLALQAADRGLPAVLASAAGLATELRLGLDLDDFDWVARADEVDVPVLIFHGPDDGYVAWEPSRDLAAARPDVVTFEQVDGAGHTRSWNADPDRYEQALLAFLAAVEPARAG